MTNLDEEAPVEENMVLLAVENTELFALEQLAVLFSVFHSPLVSPDPGGRGTETEAGIRGWSQSTMLPSSYSLNTAHENRRFIFTRGTSVGLVLVCECARAFDEGPWVCLEEVFCVCTALSFSAVLSARARRFVSV
jgi:hypothetical protein